MEEVALTVPVAEVIDVRPSPVACTAFTRLMSRPRGPSSRARVAGIWVLYSSTSAPSLPDLKVSGCDVLLSVTTRLPLASGADRKLVGEFAKNNRPAAGDDIHHAERLFHGLDVDSLGKFINKLVAEVSQVGGLVADFLADGDARIVIGDAGRQIVHFVHGAATISPPTSVRSRSILSAAELNCRPVRSRWQ